MSLKIQRRPGESWWTWTYAPVGTTANFIVANTGNDRRVLTSITFPMVSCNSGGKEFAVTSNPNKPVQNTAIANGSEFKIICELSFDNGSTYNRYSSEELTVPGQQTFNMSTGPNTSDAFENAFKKVPPWPGNRKFNFKNVPAIDSSSQIYARVRVTGVSNIYGYSGSPFIQIDDVKNISDNAESKPEEDPDPNSISLSPSGSQYITDNNITSTTTDIFKNNTCTFTIKKDPPESVIRDLKILGGGNLVRASIKENVITCTALRKDTDYSASETFTVSARGVNSLNFTINFHNKPTSVVSLQKRTLNIRTASSADFERSNPDDYQDGISEGLIWLTNSRGQLELSKKRFSNQASRMNIASHSSNGLYFLSLKSNSSNIFKIGQENDVNTIKFKVYNQNVQNVNPSTVYSSSQEINLSWSITPKDLRQISFDWVYDTDDKVIARVDVTGETSSKVTYSPGYSSLPETVVMGLSGSHFPMIGNLRYKNDDNVTNAGYCRGMRVEYITSKSESESSVANAGRVYYYDKTSEPNVTPTTVAGRISPVQSIIDKLLKLKEFYIRITPYFYFGSARTSGTTVSDTSSTSEDSRRYFGNSFTLPQKFIYVRESDFYTPFLFPTVRSSQPYTPMMLPQVERSGHFLNSTILNVRELSDRMDFGVKFGSQKEISVRKNPEYFSSTALQTHMVVNIGQAVIDFSETDSSVLSASLEIQPFIDIYYDEKYYVRISTKSSVLITDTGIAGNTNMTLPTVIYLDTRKTSMWDPRVKDPAEGERPAVHKGELIFYHDYDNFQAFINKYQNLIPNKLTNQTSFTVKPVSVSKTTEIINTEFWIEIANRISKYAESMQNWATSVNQVSWAISRFTIHKGTVIDNINPLASLFQNYWDLLVKCSSLDSFATHKYLHDMGYTHEMLSSFTHSQIMNKEGI